MSKLSRHMPGRRVSRHSKANTFPATVAFPIFRSRIFMGTGWMRMGLPIRTLPGAGLSPPFPPDAGATAGRLPTGAPAGTGTFTISSTATCRKP